MKDIRESVVFVLRKSLGSLSDGIRWNLVFLGSYCKLRRFLGGYCVLYQILAATTDCSFRTYVDRDGGTVG